MKKSLLTGRGFGKLIFHQLKILFGLLLVIGVLVSGCSDNPVEPTNHNTFLFLDSSRYEWTEIVLPVGEFSRPDIHVLNENEQFAIDTYYSGNTSSVYYLTGNTFRRIHLSPDQVLVVNTIPGKGTFLVTCLHDSPRTIKIWKWNGNNFNLFMIPDVNGDSTENVYSYSYLDRENNLWFTSKKGKAFRFDGDSINIYDLRKNIPQNRATSATDFAYNESDILKAFGLYSYTTIGAKEYSWCIYRFENEQWLLEYEEIIQMWAPDTFTMYSKVGDRIIRYQDKTLQIYDNNGGFNTHWDLTGMNLKIKNSIRGFGGKNFTEFMLPLERPNFHTKFYYYDGNTFSPELWYSNFAPFSKVEFFNDMIFHINGDYPVTKINIGRRK